MTGNLLVTPEKLEQASQEFSSNASLVQNLTNQMLETVRSMSASWTGEASTAFSNQFNQLSDDMQRIYSMMKEHSNDLQEMASNYKSAESTNASSSQAMPGDVIQ